MRQQERFDQLSIGERDASDVEPPKERVGVHILRSFIPDHLDVIEECSVELVGYMLTSVHVAGEPLGNAVVGLEDVEEVDVLLAERRVGFLEVCGASLSG